MSDDETTAREQRRIECERRNALWEKPFAEWTDEELFGELTLSYRAPEIPLCRVCGVELSCQRMGGGEPTVYACSGLLDGVLQEGRRIADEHYRRSEWKDYRQGGDGRVLELIQRVRKDAASILALATAIDEARVDVSWLIEQLGEAHACNAFETGAPCDCTDKARAAKRIAWAAKVDPGRTAWCERERRCYACGWPLAESPEKGCVPGNCSYRPGRTTPEYAVWLTRVKAMREAARTSSGEPS